jgi:hypothetical protein
MNIWTIFILLNGIIASDLWSLESKNEKSPLNEEIRVGLEETPGLLQSDGKGILNSVLREIEETKKLKFKMTYLSYMRAKLEMKKGNLDLIGLTPHKFETKNFYEYAQELDWSFGTNLVLFCTKKKSLELKKNEIIGTPAGNEQFISEVLELNVNRFSVGNLRSLIMRMKKNRIPCLAFEEISTIKIAKELGIEKLYFKKIKEVRASFAVNKGHFSQKKKDDLEKGFSEINWEKYLANVSRLPKDQRTGEFIPTK